MVKLIDKAIVINRKTHKNDITYYIIDLLLAVQYWMLQNDCSVCLT